MENENKEKCPRNQTLQLLQLNDAKSIGCELWNRDLAKCRSCLTTFCQKPIKVYHNSRNYLACSVKRSLSENSTRSLPAIGETCAPKCKNSSKNTLRKFVKSESSNFRPKAIKLSVLKENNKYRKLHGANPLKMDKELSLYAQEWANHLACRNLLETRPLPLYGENIMSVRRPLFSVERIIKLWYQEKYNYDYLKPGFNLYTGHFTQMVWGETKYLGVGVATNNFCIWIVCNYNPPGNIGGHFRENVLPRKLILIESDSEAESQEIIKSKKRVKI
ncbi:Golgi-associated plant pathogenesis-related protein 1 [Drosophila elegans]|uniref:Golgi-associated plant pathogenesis-related protein 1 n=1 Tax=Drosophila elegans TaxID=30023 RepID=UPI0007E8089A|nr:Golgi-associated plant pathogenesis-related protein 1 [Drosophila elegans]